MCAPVYAKSAEMGLSQRFLATCDLYITPIFTHLQAGPPPGAWTRRKQIDGVMPGNLPKAHSASRALRSNLPSTKPFPNIQGAK